MRQAALLPVTNAEGDDISVLISGAATEVRIDPVHLLALLDAESELNPKAERWGRHTLRAKGDIAAEDWADLATVVAIAWPDVSFGYSQRIVRFHDLGDRTADLENILSVRDGVFADPAGDVLAAARRLAGCFQHPTCDGTALSALVVYNAGSDRRDDGDWLALWAGNVASYERSLAWAESYRV